MACSSMQARTMKRSIIAGTTTQCEQIGATVAAERAKAGDVARRLCERYGGYLLGQGEIFSLQDETRGGFDFGTVELRGEAPVKVFFQNENMLAMREGAVITVVPDLICTLSEEGMPLTNADLKTGMKVTYIGFPAPKPFRTEEAFALFRPILEALEYEGPFQPLEMLVS